MLTFSISYNQSNDKNTMSQQTFSSSFCCVFLRGDLKSTFSFMKISEINWEKESIGVTENECSHLLGPLPKEQRSVPGLRSAPRHKPQAGTTIPVSQELEEAHQYAFYCFFRDLDWQKVEGRADPWNRWVRHSHGSFMPAHHLNKCLHLLQLWIMEYFI